MLDVVVNGENVLSFDRNARFPGQQRRFLDNMDLDMDEGFELEGQHIDSPDAMQRAKYVAMSMFMALQADNQDLANTMCAYLAHRLPELKQVRAIDNGNEVEMDLLFNEMN